MKKANAKNYFEEAGFRLTSERDDFLCFERGNYLFNLVAFNPLTWKSKIQMNMHADEIVVDYHISSFGHLVSLQEEMLWHSFDLNFQKSLTIGLDLKIDNDINISVTRRDSWRHLKWGLTGGAIGFFVGCGLELLLDVKNLCNIGILVGMLGVMYWRVMDEKKQDQANGDQKGNE